MAASSVSNDGRGAESSVLKLAPVLLVLVLAFLSLVEEEEALAFDLVDLADVLPTSSSSSSTVATTSMTVAESDEAEYFD